MVHSEVESLEVAAQIYAAGARGFFTLSSAPGQLPKAVNVVHHGKFWGPREAIALMAKNVVEDQKDKETAPGDEDRQLLELLNEGLSNKEIGQRLGLAEATIKARFNRLYKRFGVATRLQLLSAAIAQGLITPQGKAS
jgi:DNA-binding NarL/FixJ family response regulator